MIHINFSGDLRSLEELKLWYNGYNFTNNEIQNYEGFYASVIYAYFTGAGFDRIIAQSRNVINYGWEPNLAGYE